MVSGGSQDASNTASGRAFRLSRSFTR
jgi:hypothetical protein